MSLEKSRKSRTYFPRSSAARQLFSHYGAVGVETETLNAISVHSQLSQIKYFLLGHLCVCCLCVWYPFFLPPLAQCHGFSHSSSPNLNLIFVFALATSCCLCAFFGLPCCVGGCVSLPAFMVKSFPRAPVDPAIPPVQLSIVRWLPSWENWEPVENICPWVLRLVQRACRWPLLHLLVSIGVWSWVRF